MNRSIFLIACPCVAVFLGGSPSSAADAPEMAQPEAEVVPVAVVEIQTFVVQGQATRPIGTDRAKLEVGTKGGVKKVVVLAPSPGSKAQGRLEVDIGIITTPVNSTASAVELDVETLVRPREPDRKVRRKQMRVTLGPSASKLLNLFEHEPFGARIMAMLKARAGEPEVHIKGGMDSRERTPQAAAMRSVRFNLDTRRLEAGEEVLAESVTLNTWLGRSTSYEVGHDVPVEVIPGEDGRGTVRYASEKIELILSPTEQHGPELVFEAQVKGAIYRGSDLHNAYTIDRSATFRAKRGDTVSIYAIYGQDELGGIQPHRRETASGYVFHVTPQF